MKPRFVEYAVGWAGYSEWKPAILLARLSIALAFGLFVGTVFGGTTGAFLGLIAGYVAANPQES